MYNKNNRSFLYKLRYIGIVCCINVLSIPVAGQVVKDSTLINFFGTEAAVVKWKNSQKNKYAFDHLLQKRPIAKHFKKKKFGDRLFLEGGTSLFTAFLYEPKFSIKEIKPWAYISLGDWFTPLHGWRVSAQAGDYNINGKHSNIIGGSLDYLLNISAVAAEEYEQAKRLEFYGVMGTDFFLSKRDQINNKAFGVHMGLRGQVNMNNYTYFFFEPRIGVYSKDLIHADGWKKYDFAGSAITGFGYKLTPDQLVRKKYKTSGSFLDNTFIAIAAGPSFLLNIGQHENVEHNLGANVKAYAGKWFNSYSGIRLGIGSTYKYGIRAISGSIGYMWNLHNTFGGYEPNRKFWINAVADVSGNLCTSDDNGNDFSISYGLGLQPTIRLGKSINLFVEPRVDFYDKTYINYIVNQNYNDFAFNLMAGLVIRQGLNTSSQLKRNEDFKSVSKYDHMFAELGIGGIVPIANQAFSHVKPNVHIGLGKWFSPSSGLRLWSEFAHLEDQESLKYGTAVIGLDYLFNLTNALHGYQINRPYDLIASAGVNGLYKFKNNKINIGANVGLKGVLRLNPMTSLYLEPQLRFYDKNLLQANAYHFHQIDMLGSLIAGVQFSTNGFCVKDHLNAFKSNELNSFVSIAAGVGTSANAPKELQNYGLIGRISYGHWFNPTSAWRINLGSLAKPKLKYRYAVLNLGADYMCDITTLAYGYNSDRIVNLRAIAGINVGTDYKAKTDFKIHLAADFHIGGQLAVGISRKNELFIEPQLAYSVISKYTQRKSERINLSAALGINHKLNFVSNNEISSVNKATNDFVSLSLGSGVHTQTITRVEGKDRFTLDFDIAYGHWFNNAYGVRVGLSNASVKLRKNHGKQQITSFHTDYMFNLLALTRGSFNQESNWVVNGIAGINLNLGSSKQMGTTFAPGAQLSLEIGYKVNPKWELFAEPTGILIGKNIWEHTQRPFILHPRVMIGTKYSF